MYVIQWSLFMITKSYYALNCKLQFKPKVNMDIKNYLLKKEQTIDDNVMIEQEEEPQKN